MSRSASGRTFANYVAGSWCRGTGRAPHVLGFPERLRAKRAALPALPPASESAGPQNIEFVPVANKQDSHCAEIRQLFRLWRELREGTLSLKVRATKGKIQMMKDETMTKLMLTTVAAAGVLAMISLAVQATPLSSVGREQLIGAAPPTTLVGHGHGHKHGHRHGRKRGHGHGHRHH